MISVAIKIYQILKLLWPFIAEIIFGGQTLKHMIDSPLKNKIFFFSVVVTFFLACYSSIRMFQLASDIVKLNDKIEIAEKSYKSCDALIDDNKSLKIERLRLIDENQALKVMSQRYKPTIKMKPKEEKHLINQKTIDAVHSKLYEGGR